MQKCRLLQKLQVAANAFLQYGFRGNLPQQIRAQEGRVLSRWGDAGWGRFVTENKRADHFDDELVVAMAEMIQQRWQPNPAPQWICCVPSRNHVQLVPDFARRLAACQYLSMSSARSKITNRKKVNKTVSINAEILTALLRLINLSLIHRFYL